jgi:glycine/D-amino acid oxidase-like deaminating enzyme
VELQRAHGVPVEVLDCAAAAEITPFNPTGVAGATWGPADGQLDPHAATSAYLKLAQGHGAVNLFSSPVVAAEANDDGSWMVQAGEHTLRAQQVVNAAGGWAGEVAALAGLSVPVVHSRRNVYATATGALNQFVPMTVDFATGSYLRTEGDRLLFGGARPDPNAPTGINACGLSGHGRHCRLSDTERLHLGVASRRPWHTTTPDASAGDTGHPAVDLWTTGPAHLWSKLMALP